MSHAALVCVPDLASEPPRLAQAALLGGRVLYSGRCLVLAKSLTDCTAGGLITCSKAVVNQLAEAKSSLGAHACVALYEGGSVS